MHINNLLNIGTDSSVWTFVVIVLILSVILGIITKGLLNKYTELKKFRAWYIVLATAAMCSIWLFFGAFGAGIPVELTTAEEDGIVDANEAAPEMPTKEEIAASQEEKKSAILRRLEENLDSGISEDDYIKKAIKRSQQMEK